MAVDDEHARVPAPERLAGLAPDPSPRAARLLERRVDLLGRSNVVRERDAAPASAVGHGAVLGELGSVPQRQHHPAGLEEHDVIDYIAGRGPPRLS
jgi:hypothetical protein